MSDGFASYSDAPLDALMRKIEASIADLPKQEARVAQYILLNLPAIALETGQDIARKAGVAEITVGRMLRRFDCGGMKEFKALLRQRYSVSGEAMGRRAAALSTDWQTQMSAEIDALHRVYDQIDSPAFETAVALLTRADEVFVTGFQTVRGLAQDCAYRLGLARDRVRFLTAHEGMLSEWISAPQGASVVLIIDVIPYAAEAELIAQIAKDQGRAVVVVSDEYCHWARTLADAVITSPSRTGLFLESTLGLHAAASLLVDSVAKQAPSGVAPRLQSWKRLAHRLRLF